MNYTEIVKKLIGNVKPLGESHKDKNRLKNLVEMCHLIQDLNDILFDIVIENKDAYENSVKQSVDYANNFLIKQSNNVKEYLKS